MCMGIMFINKQALLIFFDKYIKLLGLVTLANRKKEDWQRALDVLMRH